MSMPLMQQGKEREGEKAKKIQLSLEKEGEKKNLVLLRTSVQSYATHKRCSSEISVFNS